jgi:hypothetical protein
LHKRRDLRALNFGRVCVPRNDAFEEGCKICLIPRETLIALLAGRTRGQIGRKGIVEEDDGRCMISGFVGPAAMDAPPLVPVVCEALDLSHPQFSIRAETKVANQGLSDAVVVLRLQSAVTTERSVIFDLDVSGRRAG